MKEGEKLQSMSKDMLGREAGYATYILFDAFAEALISLETRLEAIEKFLKEEAEDL